MWCSAHLDRKQERVPAYKLGLCEACYAGKSIDPFEKVYSADSPKGRLHPAESYEPIKIPYCLTCQVSLPDEQIVAIHLVAKHEVTLKTQSKYEELDARSVEQGR